MATPRGLKRKADAAWSLAGAAAAKAFARGRFEEALAEVEAAIAGDPERAWPYALRGELKRSERLGRYSEALEDMARARALEPRSFWIEGYAAKALAAGGRIPEALERAEAALALEPGCSWVSVERALLLLGLDRVPEALAEARRARALDSSSSRSRRALSLCLLSSGLPREALDALGRGAGSRAGADLSPPGGRLPAEGELRFEALKAAGLWREAASALAAAARSGERLLWLPADVRDEGALRAAAAEVGRALEAGARGAWPRFWLADLLLRLGDAAGAERELSAALAADPAHAWAWAWRAAARLRAGRGEEALRDAGRGLSAGSPGADLAWRLRGLRGEIAASLGRARAAEAELAASLALEPRCPRTWLARAAVRAAQGRGPEAGLDLARSLELSPRQPQAYLLRARLRSQRGDRAGAMSDLARAQDCAAEPAAPAGVLAFTAVRRPSEDAPAPGGEKPRRLGRAVVDPRIELAGLLQSAVAGAPESPALKRLAPELCAYAEEARARLLPFVTPELKDSFARVAAARGSASFPWLGITQMLMDVSPLPEARPLTAAWREGEDLRLLEHMRRFSRRARFLEFFAEREGLLRRALRPLTAVVGREAYAEAVSAYVGAPVEAFYDVVLAPLLKGVALRAILKRGPVWGARTVLCPLTSEEAARDFAVSPSADYLLWTGWHELLHLHIDRWAETHARELEDLRGLYDRIPPQARRKGWLDCASEHMVRAATQRLLRARRGRKAAEELAAMDRDEGYLFQDRLAARLEEYEEGRARYPSLLDFMPTWLETFKEFA